MGPMAQLQKMFAKTRIAATIGMAIHQILKLKIY
jgi:hypothetical protein